MLYASADCLSCKDRKDLSQYTLIIIPTSVLVALPLSLSLFRMAAALCFVVRKFERLCLRKPQGVKNEPESFLKATHNSIYQQTLGIIHSRTVVVVVVVVVPYCSFTFTATNLIRDPVRVVL